MAFQISIGDIVMRSKLAFRLAHAFTTGRKSAPAEFQEVQNQLYSLSKALDFFGSHTSRASPNRFGLDSRAQGGSLSAMIENCRSTLNHLERLVDKYMVLQGDHTHDPSTSHGKRWRSEFLQNWTRVKWTTEGGDLSKLQHNLAIHINSLTLAATVVNRQLERHVLPKDESSGTSITDADSVLTLSIMVGVRDRQEVSSLCPNASFGSESLETMLFPNSGRLFECRYPSRPGELIQGGKHDKELSKLSLLPTSLLVRMHGRQQLWKLRVSSRRTSRVTTLLLGNVSPSKLVDFESRINELAMAQARRVVSRRVGSMLAFPCVDTHGQPQIAVLNMMCDTRHLHDRIARVDFLANGQCYSQKFIKTIQLLLYKALSEAGESSYKDSGELVFHVGTQSGNEPSSIDLPSRLIVNIDHSNRVAYGPKACVLRVCDVDCVSESDSGQRDQVRAANVQVELSDMKSTNVLLQRIEQLQQGLLMYKLRSTQSCERVVYQMPIEMLTVHNYHLVNATLRLLFNTSTGQYRLVILNASNSVCVSIELPLSFFHHLATTNDTALFLNYPCWISDSSQQQTMLYEHRSGITLTCASDETQQLLVMLLRSVAQGDQILPLRAKNDGPGLMSKQIEQEIRNDSQDLQL
ncbi:hypothetical protein VTN00DRAFT_3530 [Thermoascus crustaceus]|uniref:uncharacterized protein n=1 Tax=Thermoascus crustaceus TaxID=5088 RepID=UPI003742155F